MNTTVIFVTCRWSLQTCCPGWVDHWGGVPAAGGESQWVGSGCGRGRVGREHGHFESGHTCLSVRGPNFPWLAGRAEQRCRAKAGVREAEGNNNRRSNKKLSRRLSVSKNRRTLEQVQRSVAPTASFSVYFYPLS